MASTLPFISREELDDLENELRTTKPGWSPDIDALQITILLDLILAFRQGQIVGCPPPTDGVGAACDAARQQGNNEGGSDAA